jgi:hypothetical protein
MGESAGRRSVARSGLLAALLAGLLVAGLPALPAQAGDQIRTGPSGGVTPSWLARFNGWRAIANLPALTENTSWSQGDYNHSVYMVKDDQVTHYENPAYAYYTAAGNTAAQNSNIEVNSTTSFTDVQAIDFWMAAPFHALGMMDPRLTQTGFGAYREVKSGWQAGFSLDDLRGNSFTGGTYPVYFPGNGSTVPLRSYGGGEFPDPLQACPGYRVPTGLPVFIQVGGSVATTVSAHSFTGNGTPLAHCVIDSTNPAVGSGLATRGAVIVIPQQPLQPGVHYVVALTVNGAPYTWSFGVTTINAMVPGAPIVTSAVAGDTTATVSWNPPAYDGGTAISGYSVSAYVGSALQTTQVLGASSTSANFTGLIDGTTYWFTVAATNSIGTGQAASSYSVTPTSSATPPARITAPSQLQYQLPNSDGVTWQDIDAVNLSLSVTPTVDSMAIVSANADLWTANAGYNQDIGLWLSSSANPASIVAWKESGGSAGTFSPNAAEVQTVLPMTASTTYSVKLDWKTNKPALGASIFAGAGPVAGRFSPTRLTVVLIPIANLATGVSTDQYTLPNSDGVTWNTMDATKLSATLAPSADGQAVVSANADLWTASAGFNQDLAVFVTVDGGADQMVAWKEAGGGAGTFSPNAAFVEATWPVTAGSRYVFKLEWKANRYAPGTIFAGAGPLAGLYSPTRLTAFFEPSGAIATAATNAQYHLTGSDGATWQSPDSSGLLLGFTPGSSGNFVVSANADLWTATAGYNQDIGIVISGGSFTTPTLVAWKESGGRAGTYSPNAAYVETELALQSATTYSIWLVWKTNAAAGGATIFAAAGPLAGGQYSPTRLLLFPG